MAHCVGPSQRCVDPPAQPPSPVHTLPPLGTRDIHVGCVAHFWGIGLTEKTHRAPGRTIWARIHESQVPRASPRNRNAGSERAAPFNPWPLPLKTPHLVGWGVAAGGTELGSSCQVSTEYWRQKLGRMGINSGRQPLPVGAEVGTAILEGNLVVAAEISNARRSILSDDILFRIFALLFISEIYSVFFYYAILVRFWYQSFASFEKRSWKESFKTLNSWSSTGVICSVKIWLFSSVKLSSTFWVASSLIPFWITSKISVFKKA